MEPQPLSFAINACGGGLLSGSPEVVFRRVCTDSRALQRDDLFVAISGEKFDGHHFVAQAAEKDAAGAMIAHRHADAVRSVLPSPARLALIAVDDTRQALGRLAARYRERFSLPVVAVAGSNGKTTTKELLASVLRQHDVTLASQASFNNDIGVPLTLLKLEARHRAAVLEVGTNHPGELAPLLRLVQPRFGILTNIAREHLEFFHDLAGVAREEGWLAELLPADGVLFVNGDDQHCDAIAARARARVVRIGLSAKNLWRAEHLRTDERGVAFRVVAPRPDFTGEFRVNLLGRHQVLNALLALATAAEIGASPEAARVGLASCAPPQMRLQVWHAGEVTVLDDAYNANADSMIAALHVLRDFPCRHWRIAVLGDMAELGDHTAQAHAEIGLKASELGVDWLITVGRWARVTAQSAQTAGLKQVNDFSTAQEAVHVLREGRTAGDVILLKASRVAALEQISEALRSEAAPSPNCERHD